MNNVDISSDTVKKEWDNIALNFKIDEVDEVVEELGSFVYSDEDIAEKEVVTSGLILASLSMVLSILDVDIAEEFTEDFANAWAVVIVKRFPDNPITDFMAEYGDLIGAGSATLILIGAIKKSKKIKAEEAKKMVVQNLKEKSGENENG